MLQRLHELFNKVIHLVDARDEKKHQGVANEFVTVRRDLDRAISDQKRLEAQCLNAKNKFDLPRSAELEVSLKEQRRKTKELKVRLSDLEARFHELDTRKIASLARDKAARQKAYARPKSPLLLRPVWIAVVLGLACAVLGICWFLSNYDVTFQ